MNLNAQNNHYAAQRDDGYWGVANDRTGRSRYEAPGFPTEAAAIAYAARLDGEDA